MDYFQIELTKDQITRVDEDIFNQISGQKWQAHWSYNKYRAEKGSKKNGKSFHIHLHRMIMGNPPKNMDVDHINGDTLDNRRENLRICTHAENARNCGARSHNKSGIKGVNFDRKRNKWLALITYNGKTKNL